MVNWRKLLDMFLEAFVKGAGYATGILFAILLISIVVLMLLQNIDVSLEKVEAFGIIALLVGMLALVFRESTPPPRRYL